MTTTYTTKPIKVEAMRWSGPTGSVTITELQDWGAPVVVLRPTFPSETTPPELALTVDGRSVAVPIGSWVIRHDGKWRVAGDDEFRSRFERLGAIEPGEDPLPGLPGVTVRRIGFRRKRPTDWEWRLGGLTQGEMRQGGWKAVYEVEALP